jgi:hypothetical protein
LVLPNERKVNILYPSNFGGEWVMVGILNLVEKLRREDRLRDLEGGPPLFGSFAELIVANHLVEQTCHRPKLLKVRHRNTAQKCEYQFRVLKYKSFAKDGTVKPNQFKHGNR